MKDSKFAYGSIIRSKRYIRLIIYILLLLIILTYIPFPSRTPSTIPVVDEDYYDLDQNNLKEKEEQYDWSQDIRPCLKSYATTKSYQSLLNCIKLFNSKGPILNHESFPETTLVIAIITHKRDIYLRKVLEYLSRVNGIENVLLVVSHDGYYSEVISLVKKIKFCKVMLVFHPFAAGLTKRALELYSDDTELDIPTTVKNQQRTIVEYDFNNAKGSFIEDPRFTQTAPKHHYWWLWNFIFKSYENVLFLEEDHVVTPDILEVLSSLKNKCDECFGINLGHHTTVDTININTHNQAQYNVLLNIGMHFNATMFKKYIWSSRKEFCSFNDYNWDLTLGHMANVNVMPQTSLTVTLPRVYHIGNCGMHTESTQCSPDAFLNDVDLKVIEPLSKVEKADFSVLREFKDKPYCEREGSDGVEGWLNGRLWDQKRPQYIKEFWESSVNEQHCYQLAETDKAWSWK